MNKHLFAFHMGRSKIVTYWYIFWRLPGCSRYTKLLMKVNKNVKSRVATYCGGWYSIHLSIYWSALWLYCIQVHLETEPKRFDNKYLQWYTQPWCPLL